jgi:hypothetical protein
LFRKLPLNSIDKFKELCKDILDGFYGFANIEEAIRILVNIASMQQ